MVRLLAVLLALTLPAAAQPAADRFPGRPEIMQGIERNEAALQKAEVAHASAPVTAQIYSNLGSLYRDAALYPKSEDALRHSVALLRNGPQDKLADALGHLSLLHSAMNEPTLAGKEQLETLRLRENIGDPIGIALARSDLTAIYVRQHRYKKAAEFGQPAFDIVAANPSVDAKDRLAVMESFAYALCGEHQCLRAIAILKNALHLAASAFGPDSLSVGIASYLLGHTYWDCGQNTEAAEWMQRGLVRMKQDMGWGYAIYISSMAQYAQFLRKRGQTEQASAAEREVKQVTSIVDARSFTSRP